MALVVLIRKHVKHTGQTHTGQRIYVAALRVEQELRPIINSNWWFRRLIIMALAAIVLLGVVAAILGAICSNK